MHEWIEGMARTKIEWVFKDFPWLKRFVHESTVKMIFVKRVDKKLLWKNSECYPDFGGGRSQEIFLVGPKGECFGKVGLEIVSVPMERRWWNCLWWKKTFRQIERHHAHETILSAITRTRHPVHFIVSIKKWGRKRNKKDVTVYKSPINDYSIQSWFTQLEVNDR